MSKKILTVLAPVAAIVAFMALPALAQATQVQCGATECANGAVIKGQSTNLATATQNPTGSLTCANSEFEGTVTANQGETVEGNITKDTLSTCVANGHTAHIKTNATVAAPWKLQVQQPAGGVAQGHIHPAAGGTIRFTVQVQEFGFSVATCVFAATTVQLNNTEQTDTATVTGTNQFSLVEKSGIAANECGSTVPTVTTGDLTGSFQLETAAGAAVVVHMS